MRPGRQRKQLIDLMTSGYSSDAGSSQWRHGGYFEPPCQGVRSSMCGSTAGCAECDGKGVLDRMHVDPLLGHIAARLCTIMDGMRLQASVRRKEASRRWPDDRGRSLTIRPARRPCALARASDSCTSSAERPWTWLRRSSRIPDSTVMSSTLPGKSTLGIVEQDIQPSRRRSAIFGSFNIHSRASKAVIDVGS